jgi:putative tricarboxylic transport membrane protein
LTNVITVVICFIFLRRLAAITFVKGTLLVPFLLAFIALGAFTATNNWLDIMVMLVFGLLGWAMEKWQWPVAPLILGLVIGPIAEINFYTSQTLYEWDWLSRPIVIAITLMIVMSLLWSPIAERISVRNGHS